MLVALDRNVTDVKWIDQLGFGDSDGGVRAQGMPDA
jgi:hypothetical protein